MVKLYTPSLRLIITSLLLTSAAANAQYITTVGGNGTSGYTADGIAATSSRLNAPASVAYDAAGNLYVADAQNHRVRKISATGTITTVAGTGTAGFGGDGSAATSAQLNTPMGVAVDAAGNIYIADNGNNRIRRINIAGNITTIAGTATGGFAGDGGAATSAQLNGPVGLFVNGSGSVFVADKGNHRVRMINGSGVITTVAGTGTSGFSGDGGVATSAQLNNPTDVTIDGSGNIYIADNGNHRVRMVLGNGNINTVAGTGLPGYSGDYGTATSAQLNGPTGLGTDGSAIYIADAGNNIIRKLSGGIISPVAGNGNTVYNADGEHPLWASLYNPTDVVATANGALYIADNQNHRIRLATAKRYKDNDGDGFGKGTEVFGLSNLTGYVENMLDCNDSSGNAMQWTGLGTSGFTKGAALQSTITTDNNGNRVVVFRDGNANDKVSVYGDAVGYWSAIGKEAFSAGAASTPDIAYDAFNLPYVVYSDAGNSGKASVMKFDGLNWGVLGTAGFSATAANATKILIDPKGTPMVSYSAVGSGKANVMRYAGGSWSQLGSADFSAGAATNPDIAVDGTGRPYVLFADGANSGKATVMRYDNTWSILGTAGFSAGSITHHSLIIDPQGSPVVAFADGANSGKATVMRYNGTSWSTVGAAGFSAAAASYVKIATDLSGNLYVAYMEQSNSKVVVMKHTVGGWVNIGTGGVANVAAGEVSMTIGKDGLPYVAYVGTGNSNKLSVAGIALTPKAPTAPTFAAADTVCSGDPTVLSINGGQLNDATHWQWYSGSCGGTTLSTNTTLAVTPSAKTTYYARAEGSCVTNPAPCGNVTIEVNPVLVPTVALTASPDTNLPAANVPVTFTANITNGGGSPVYEWYKNGNKLSSVTGATYSAGVLNNGDVVCVHLLSDATCAKPSLVTTCATIHFTASVADVDKNSSIQLYPNPNAGSFELNVGVKEHAPIKLEVLNAMGQRVYEETHEAVGGTLHAKLNLDKNIVEGLYILRITGKETRMSSVFSLRR